MSEANQRVRTSLRIGLRATDPDEAARFVERERVARLFAGIDGRVRGQRERMVEERRPIAAAVHRGIDEQRIDHVAVHGHVLVPARQRGAEVGQVARVLQSFLEVMAGQHRIQVAGLGRIWQFGELGYGFGQNECLRNEGSDECPAGAPGRTDQKPIRWQYRTDPLREKLYKTWSALINLRNEHEVFTSLETEVEMDVRQGRAVRWIRLTHPTMNAVIFGNFGTTEQTATMDFVNEGTWYDYFSGESVAIAARPETMRLLPGEFRVYTNEPVDPPEPGLITVGTESPLAELPGRASSRLRRRSST